MKKVFYVLVAAVLALPVIVVYSQPSQQPSTSLMTLESAETYRLAPLKAHQESLESYNANNYFYMNNSPVSKASTGFVNTTTAWTDVPLKISEETEKSNPLAGWTVGFGEGFISGMVRTGAGIIDMVTFAMPPYDEPLIKPEHKVEDPNKGFSIDILRW